ncbi:hypothetical protein BDR06DRAFT_977753 [Suillus hirtellus]|nr:hypothetical protein BDR06DRAFT_977753 [Suillus hirtellus]
MQYPFSPNLSAWHNAANQCYWCMEVKVIHNRQMSKMWMIIICNSICCTAASDLLSIPKYLSLLLTGLILSNAQTKGPIYKVSVAKWVNAWMQPVKHKSNLEDQGEESEQENADDRMDEENVMDESLLAPAEEGYDVALSSPLANPYTQLTFPESSPPVIPAAQHCPNCLIMPSSTQGLADWDMQFLHHSTEDDSIEVTAPPPLQFMKVNPKTKPASARPETILSQANIQVFSPQPADGRGISAIPYGHPSIFTLIFILEAYKLHELDSFEDWDNSSPVVPSIPYQEGYMCTFQGCYFATISKQHIQTHDRDSHHTRNNWKSCTVQAFYASMQRKYPVVIPHPPPVLHVPPGSQDFLTQVESFYEQHHILHNGCLGLPMDRAHLNPFLAKYNWLEVIKDKSPSDIIDWVKMPEKDESELIGILPCFQRYFGGIIKLLTDENAFQKTQIFHDLNNRPFKAPLQKQTVQRYVRTFTKLIAFVSQAWDSQLDCASNSTPQKVALASKIQSCSKRLLTDIDQCQAAHSASHDLIMALLTTQYLPSTLLECPGKLFFIFSCVKLSSQTLDPIHINLFLSKLRWCLRAGGFYQICLLFENAPALVMENNPQVLIKEVHRNVHWFSGHLNFMSHYNKTQTNQEKEQTLAMLTLYLSLDGEDFQFSAGYEDHLFNGLHGSWDSDDFSDILVAHTSRSVSEGGLGHPMGLADIRHLLITVMHKNCKRLVVDLDLEYYFDEQSGHQGEVARGYVVDHMYVQSISTYTFHQQSQPVWELNPGSPYINPLRFQELRSLIGCNASFTSIEQAYASEAVNARAKDLIIALLDELHTRFEAKGLPTLTWSAGLKTYDAKTIFVFVKQLESPSFFDYLREGVQQRALSRIIVAFTAMLPPATIPRFFEHFQMLSGATEIICGDTTRTEISFNSCTIIGGQLSIPSLLHFQDAQKREQSYLKWLAGLLLNLPSVDKILVFCQTKATTEGMAKASDTRFYHSELPDKEKKNTLDSFRAGTGTFHVLYTTSALSAVVHLHKPNSMLDYRQEFGHGCRDRKPGWAFIFHDPKHKPFALQTGQDDTGVLMPTLQNIHDPSLAMLPVPEYMLLPQSQPSLHPQPELPVPHRLLLVALPQPPLAAPTLSLELPQFTTSAQHSAPPMLLPAPLQ